MEIKLTEYQKKIIAERTKLDFNEELKKSNNIKSRKGFNKNFRNELDILINQFYHDGIMFYGFTIDMIDLKKDNPKMWEEAHSTVEYWIQDMVSHIELVEFCYFSIELHTQKRLKKRDFFKENKKIKSLAILETLDGMPHLHGIVGVRTILGENKYLDLEIMKVFRGVHGIDDVMIKKLSSIKAIKGYWNYIIKENNFKFHRFTRFTEDYIDIYGSISQLELIYDMESGKHCAFDLDITLGSKTAGITGIKVRKPQPKTVITYLLNLFMWYKNYKIHKNKIYMMISGSKYSWKQIDTLEALKKNNIVVFECLKKVYPMQLGSVNTMEIIFSDWNKTIDDIITNNNYLSYVDFQPDAIEFLDGIYFINENKFMNFSKKINEISLKMKNKDCCVYFEKSYHNIKTPDVWLKAINDTLENSTEFCIDFARYFHSEPLEKLKQKSLVITGESNTGKTTLISNVIINLFGIENIGIIGKSDNFMFEQIENKKVIIVDEFKYSSSSRSDLLKLTNNELQLINKKGIQKYSYRNLAPVIFMSNPEKNSEIFEDKAFKNRLKHYEFRNQFKERLNNIDEILKEELPSILVYCNRLYFKNRTKNQISFEHQNNKKNNILLLLEKEEK